MIEARTIERLLPWLLRAEWVAVLVVGGEAIDAAVDGRSGAVQDMATYGGLAGWLVGVAAMAIPGVVSLTATRVVAPLSVAAAIAALFAGAGAAMGSSFLGVSVLATATAMSGDLGGGFVQASAYGDEHRFVLKPPLAYAIVAAFGWLIWATLVIAGPLALADHRWITGGAMTAVATIGAWWLWPRWHRLARRWLVVVPIGLVLHDHLVLAETLMLPRSEITRVGLAPVGTQAADFTGPATGHAVEISTLESVTALLAARPDTPAGTAIHLTACLVSPTRPGRALRAAKERRLPVG